MTKMVEMKSKVKHDGQVFYPGERRVLDQETAAYFEKHGWATTVEVSVAESVPASAGEVTLDVHGGKHSSKSKVE